MKIKDFQRNINKHFENGLYKQTFYNPLTKPKLLKFKFCQNNVSKLIRISMSFENLKRCYTYLTEGDITEFLGQCSNTDSEQIYNNFIDLFTLKPTLNERGLKFLDREYRSKTGFKNKRKPNQIKQDFEREIHKLEECFETMFNIEIKQGVYIEFDYKHFGFEIMFNL